MIRILAFLLFVISAPAWAGEVVMTKVAGVWTVYKEDGSVLDTSGTTCEGLDKAVNYVVENGHDLKVNGGGILPNGADPSVINCTAPLVVPPAQKLKWTMGAVTLNFVGTEGVVFDSCMMCRINWGGQVVNTGSHPAVTFRPRTQLPLDPETSIVDSSFRFTAIAAIGETTGAEAVRFETGQGSVDRNTFEFVEINAGGRWHALRVLNNAHSFTENRVIVGHAHSSHGVAILIGTETIANIVGNYFNVNVTPAANAWGVLTRGSNDEWHITANASIQSWMILEAPANDNLIFRRRVNGSLVNNSGNQHRVY